MQAGLEEALNGYELTNGCLVYNMTDAKVSYLIFGHSGWASHKNITCDVSATKETQPMLVTNANG